MLPRSVAALVVTVACLAVGCAGDTKPKPPQRVVLTDAEVRIVESLRKAGDGSTFLKLVLEETTPPDAFEQLGVQTFRVKEDLYEYETFAVTDEEVVQIGTGLGGPGITTFLLADADGDGKPDLAYVGGSGRGVKSYNAGVIDRPLFEPFDPAVVINPAIKPQPRHLRKRDAAFSYRDPIELRPSDEGGFDVYDPNKKVRLGHLKLVGDRADFEPADDLPSAVKRRFISPRL